MICYDQVTNLGTNTTGYRLQVHTTFNRYPELNFLAEQQLADQIRIIIKTNRISQPELENIKRQVQQILKQNNMQLEEEEEDRAADLNTTKQTRKNRYQRTN